jgi:hypothetical protein
MVFDIFLFGFIFCFLFFIFFTKGQGEFLQRYLSFLVVTSSFFVMVFDTIGVTWLTLLCAVGLIIHARFSTKKTIFFSLLAVILFAVYRVPANPYDFETGFLQEMENIHCSVNKCVEVKEVVIQDNLQIQTDTYMIQDFSFEWYVVFAAGEIQFDNRTMKAINIAGFSIQLT